MYLELHKVIGMDYINQRQESLSCDWFLSCKNRSFFYFKFYSKNNSIREAFSQRILIIVLKCILIMFPEKFHDLIGLDRLQFKAFY
jgi:hypothetical protein